MFILRLLVPLILCLPLFNVQAQAQSHSGKQVEQSRSQIEELRRQIEDIQSENQRKIEQLQRKIEQLEAERAVEKEKEEKVLAEEKDAWYKQFEAGYKKGFFLKSKDGNFSMRMRLRTQFQFSVNDTDEEDTATDFNIRRFRIKWDGHAFRPWFHYVAQISADNNGEFQLRDAYFDAAYETQIFPRVGQYKVPFSREELTSSSSLQLVERSIVNEEFALGRDRGATVYGLLANMFTYGAGIFNGDGTNGMSVDSNLLYAGRIQFNPCCGRLKYGSESFPITGAYELVPNFGAREPILAIGGGVAVLPGLNITRKTPDSDVDARYEELGITSGDLTQVTADINFKYQIFSMTGEYDGRWIDPDTSNLGTVYDQGFRVQAGIFLLPNYIELAGRWAYIRFGRINSLDPEIIPRKNRWQITPGLNFYLSKDHRWKVQLDYNFIKNEFLRGSDVDENIFRAQLQAYF